MGNILKVASVSPGIEPGYILFPSQKIILYSFIWRTAIVWKIREISSNALGLSVMTPRKCRVDRPFPGHVIR
jgi:hypothetical protein